MRVLLASITLLLGSIACGQAQPPRTPAYQTVLPGSAALDPSRMRPHRVEYRKGDNSMIYDLQRGERNGEEVWRLDIYFNVDESGTPDELYFGIDDLGYRGRRLSLADYVVDVSFEDGWFHGALTPTPGSDRTPITYDRRYEHGAFEPAIMNYWIAALPLAEGYTASLPVFDLSDGSRMFWANIEVEGREDVEIDGHRFETWRVRSRGIRDKTVWVTTTEPYAIQMVTRGNPGTWRLVP